MNEKKKLYTIGYSSFSPEEFADVLSKYGITALADVRSSPYSAYHPDYNRDNLRNFLKRQGIQYVYLGRELGARFEDPAVYDQGRANFEKIAAHPLFRQGLERLKDGAQEFTIALMCAEKDPLTCHRTLLVSRNLTDAFRILHILGDGTVEEHAKTEDRLLKLFKLDQFNLPGVKEESLSLNEAYRLQSEKIAYSVQEEAQTEEDIYV